MPNSKFEAVVGEVLINSPLDNCVKVLLEYGSNIDQSSPKQVLEFMVFQKFFFWTKEDEEAYQSTRQGTPRSFSFFVHSAARSPAPLIVSHRDFVAVGFFKTDAKKCQLVLRGLDYPERVKGLVRGQNLVQILTFEQKESGTVFRQFIHADPCGSIPASVYNMALDARNDILLLMKGFVEGTITM